MTDEDVFNRLRAVLLEILGRQIGPLERETMARHIDGWTSLNHLQIIHAVEKEFGIKISLPEIMRMKNIGDLLDIIKAKAS